MKPHLACDIDLDKVKYPLIVQPKIDGVRGLNLFGKFTGRSLKTFKNKYVTAQFSHSSLLGFDGEIAAEHECHPRLCSLTTSALGTIERSPYVLWWLFDYVTVATQQWPYSDRLKALCDRVEEIKLWHPHLGEHLRNIPFEYVTNREELEAFDAKMQAMGFEGTIGRDANAPHKSGRCTAREGALVRWKQWIDAEAVVTAVEEGDHNANEATINALGQTERSSHQANKIPNGMVGSLTGTALESIDVNGKTFIQQGHPIVISPGRLTEEERKLYFQRQDLIIGKVIKFKFFPKGLKDKLRFPTFQSFRSAEDMSE